MPAERVIIFDFIVGVKFQPESSAGETSRRRGEESMALRGGGGDKSERRKLQLDAPRRRTFADDIQRPRFHCRVEDFFNGFVQTVDLVYKGCRPGERLVSRMEAKSPHSIYGRAGSGFICAPSSWRYQRARFVFS